MFFTRLGSGNSLQMCKDVCGLAKSMTSIIVREFFATIKKHLKPLMIFNSLKTKNQRNHCSNFQSLRKIAYILGAINGNDLPIIVPKIIPRSYYCIFFSPH
jgi:hypothetical protein